MAKPLVSASYDKSRFLVMHDPDAHPLESLARGKSSVSSSFLPEKTN
jgi:hypothetical protein